MAQTTAILYALPSGHDKKYVVQLQDGRRLAFGAQGAQTLPRTATHIVWRATCFATAASLRTGTSA